MYESVRFYRQLESELMVTTPVVSYTGPGDVVSGALGWWGLRAYSLASIGSNAVRLRETGGSTEQDFATVAGGGLNLAAIAAFKGANNVFITKLYDQTGNGNDLVQATAIRQPQFLAGTLGTLPAIRYIVANPSALVTSTTFTQAQPFTWITVAQRSGGFSTIANIMSAGPTSADQWGPYNAPNGWFLDTAAALMNYSPVSDSAFHGLAVVPNGASTLIGVDGSLLTPPFSPGTTGLSADNLYTGTYIDDINNPFDGYSTEIGFWGSGFTSGQIASMSTNQHTYWGF